MASKGRTLKGKVNVLWFMCRKQIWFLFSLKVFMLSALDRNASFLALTAL